MTLTSKKIIYSLVLLLYIIVASLNYFTVLIIVPFIASGWAIFVPGLILKESQGF